MVRAQGVWASTTGRSRLSLRAVRGFSAREFAALPPDVRKVSDLPRDLFLSPEGYALLHSI